jgi:hypothetical protein
VAKALPYLLERGLPDDALTPLERAARRWRREAEQDLAGELASTKRALLDARAACAWPTGSRAKPQNPPETPRIPPRSGNEGRT